MLKHEKLPSTNSTKSGDHYNLLKIQENKHTPEHQRQFCDDLSDTALIEHNGITLDWGSLQSCRSVDADAWCKRILKG